MPGSLRPTMRRSSAEGKASRKPEPRAVALLATSRSTSRPVAGGRRPLVREIGRAGLVGCRWLLAEDLLDPGDRLVDRLLEADALGHDTLDRLCPDVLLPEAIVPPVALPSTPRRPTKPSRVESLGSRWRGGVTIGTEHGVPFRGFRERRR